MCMAYLLVEPDLSFNSEKVTDVDSEIEKFRNAIDTSKVELTKIRNNAEENLGANIVMNCPVTSVRAVGALTCSLLILSSIGWINSGSSKTNRCASKIAALSAPRFSSALFLIFVNSRVLAHILGVELPNPSMIDESVVIIGNDLTPSDTAQLNKEFVQGFVTNIGGRTSHSAIMSRSLEIPAIVGTKSITQEVKQGDMIIVDGLTGDI